VFGRRWSDGFIYQVCQVLGYPTLGGSEFVRNSMKSGRQNFQAILR
jgi:hypothetical protein